MTNGVPNELFGGSPGEIANVLGLEDPGFGSLGLGFFVLFGFLWRDDEHRGFGIFRFLETLAPLRLENPVGILELTGGGHHMVGRNGDLDVVVTEFEGKLTAPQEGLVLPATCIGVGTNAWKPLGDFVDLPALFESLHVAPARACSGIGDGVAPVDLESEFLIGLQWLGKVNSHHGVDNAVIQLGSAVGGEFVDLESTV